MFAVRDSPPVRLSPSGSGRRGARIHTSCAVVSAPTPHRAFARWCFTVECDSRRRWAAALLRPGDEDRCDDADLRIRGAFAGVGRPARRALWRQSHGSGGAATRIVIGRSMVAGLSPSSDQRTLISRSLFSGVVSCALSASSALSGCNGSASVDAGSPDRRQSRPSPKRSGHLDSSRSPPPRDD